MIYGDICRDYQERNTSTRKMPVSTAIIWSLLRGNWKTVQDH